MIQKFVIFLVCFNLLSCSKSQNAIQLIADDSGHLLQVNGQDFVINGMNWDYFPIGTNYEYSLWDEPEEIIQKALDYEMQLLQEMGVNSIRVYTGIPPKWITYIYENFGIYTMLNHSFGRYGLSIDNQWVAQTNYADPKTQEILLAEVTKMAKTYKDTPGLLFYLLGNENNYGLFWHGAETEDIPSQAVQDKEIIEQQARPMYQLMNKASLQLKSLDPQTLTSICNGDLMYLDVIAEECKDIDIFGVNIYRGISFDNTFERVKNEYGKPLMFTEFGADAYNAILQNEDEISQAYYLIHNWKEIYQNVYGLGKAQNMLGGYSFQWSDGWWKVGQTKNLNVQDTTATWANGGYYLDYTLGENNMNEEWFGIMAKTFPDENNLFQLKPRQSYYKLKEMHQIKPLSEEVDVNLIQLKAEELLQEIKDEIEQIKKQIN